MFEINSSHSQEIVLLNKKLVDIESTFKNEKTSIIQEYSNKLVASEELSNKKFLQQTEGYEKILLELQKHQLAFKEASTMIDELKNQNKTLQQGEIRATARADELAIIVQQQKQQVNDLINSKHDQIHKLQEIIKRLENKCDMLQRHATDTIPTLETQAQMFTLDNKTKDEIIARLEARIKENETIVHQKSQLELVAKKEVDHHLQSLQEKISKLEKQTSDLEDIVKIKNQIIQDKEESLREYKFKLSRIETEKSNEINNYVAQIQELERNLEDNYQEIDDMTKKLNKLNISIEEYGVYCVSV